MRTGRTEAKPMKVAVPHVFFFLVVTLISEKKAPMSPNPPYPQPETYVQLANHLN